VALPSRGQYEQFVEKRFEHVMLSEAKHLLFPAFNNLQDSSSPAAPQNDTNAVFFNKLLGAGKLPALQERKRA
jgi:hypothetical protein